MAHKTGQNGKDKAAKSAHKNAHPLAARRAPKNDKKPKRRRSFWDGFGLFFALCVLIGGGAVFTTVGLDSLRPQLEGVLSRAAGRSIRLAGNVGLGFSPSRGLSLSVRDVVVDNPSWASRPEFARIGRLDVGVALRPLLDRRIEILSFVLSDADIQVEKGPSGAVNWRFGESKKDEAVTAAKEDKANSDKLGFHLKAKGLRIEDSRLTFRAADGQTTPVRAETLDIVPGAEGVEAHFVGVIGDIPVRFDADGGRLEDVLGEAWPFRADVQYGKIVMHAEGLLQNNGRKVSVMKSRIASNDTNLAATLTVDLSASRPKLTGQVQGGYLSLADLTPDGESGASSSSAAKSSGGGQASGRFFSDREIDLTSLTSLDADIDFSLNALALGMAQVNTVRGHARLENGRLLLSPLSGYLAGSLVEGQLHMDGVRKPAAFGATLKARGIDLSQVALITGTEGFLVGKADMDMDLSAKGNTPHEIASQANGIIRLQGAGGTISGKVLGNIAQTMLSAFMPGQSSGDQAPMNCIAAEAAANEGVLKIEAIAIDTPYATIVGDGVVNLGEEALALRVETKAKGIGITAGLPLLLIDGTLMKPQYHASAVDGARKLVGAIGEQIKALKNGSFGASEKNQDGGACVAILSRRRAGLPLDAPKPEPSASPIISPKSTIEKLGDDLLNNLGGKLLRGM